MSPESWPPQEQVAAAYTVLSRIASRYLRSSEPLTLQTASLVHEAYLKLAARSDITLRGAGHAQALMARAMRQVLIDHIRRRRSEKHRPPGIRVAPEAVPGPELEVETLHRALDRLEASDPEAARILEMVYFGGYRQSEIAAALGVTDRTVRNRLQAAQAALRRVLEPADDPLR